MFEQADGKGIPEFSLVHSLCTFALRKWHKWHKNFYNNFAFISVETLDSSYVVGIICPPPLFEIGLTDVPKICVQMGLTQTFETTTKCNNINRHFFKFLEV